MFYTVFSAIWGFLLGARDRLGEVNIPMISSPFAASSDLPLLCHVKIVLL